MKQRKISYYINLLVFVIALLVVSKTSAQQQKKDSLWGIWKDTTQSDSSRLKALNNYAWRHYLFSDQDSALRIAIEGFQYAHEKDLNRYMGYFVGLEGAVYKIRGDYGIAELKMLATIEYYKKDNNLRELSGAYNNLASVYNATGNNKKAIDQYMKGLKIAEQIGHSGVIADCLNNLGVMHYRMKHYKEAKEYFTKALRLSEKMNSKRRVSKGLNNLGAINSEMKNYTEAIDNYARSIAIKMDLNDEKGIASSYSNMGRAYLDLDSLSKAEHYYMRSLNMWKEIGNDVYIANNYSRLANLFKVKGDLDKAQQFGEKALKHSENNPFLPELEDGTEILWEIYKLKGNHKQALSMYELFVSRRDSVLKKENKKELISRELKYEYDKKKLQDSLAFAKQMEIDKITHQAQLDKEVNRRYALYLGLFFLLLMGAFGYRGYKRKQKLNVLLKQQNEQKGAMLKEVHHRVKNNLQMVNSLLKMQSRALDDEKAIAMFKEAQNRVLSMALLHEKMYRSEDLQHIDIEDHITLLVEDLVKGYAVGKKIQTKITVNSIDIGLRTLVPLGLIINEIITNALKYAFVNSDHGTITVGLKKLELGVYELIIGDDGIGKDESVTSHGLGEKLISAFTRQLKGEIKRLETPGTVYKLQFQKID